MLTIRRAAFQDRIQIEDFSLAAFGPEGAKKRADYWNWLYRDNPFRSGKEPDLWLAFSDGGSLIGQLCGIPVDMMICARKIRAMWAMDLIVLPEARNQGVARALYKRVFEEHDVVMTLVSSPVTNHIMLEGGATEIAEISLFSRPTGEPLPEIGETKTVEVCQVQRFGTEVDQLWERVSHEYSAGIVRDSTYLNWKFLDRPGPKYFGFIARSEGKVSGYAILRAGCAPEENIGMIAEVFASPSDFSTWAALYRSSIEYFRSSHVPHVLAGTSCLGAQKVLQMLGFRGYTKIPLYFFARDTKRVRDLKKAAPLGWFLGRAESDWDHYPDAFGVDRDFRRDAR